MKKLSILVLFVFLATGSAIAHADCQGTSPTQAQIAALFAAGAPTFDLGAVTYTATSRACTSLTGCGDWAATDVKLLYAEYVAYGVNGSYVGQNSITDSAVVTIPDTRATLSVYGSTFALNFFGGDSSTRPNAGPVLDDEAIAEFDATSQSFKGTDSLNLNYSFSTPVSTGQGGCENIGGAMECDYADVYQGGRFSVADVAIESVPTVVYGDHCVDVNFVQTGSTDSTGVYHDVTMTMSMSY